MISSQKETVNFSEGTAILFIELVNIYYIEPDVMEISHIPAKYDILQRGVYEITA